MNGWIRKGHNSPMPHSPRKQKLLNLSNASKSFTIDPTMNASDEDCSLLEDIDIVCETVPGDGPSTRCISTSTPHYIIREEPYPTVVYQRCTSMDAEGPPRQLTSNSYHQRPKSMHDTLSHDKPHGTIELEDLSNSMPVGVRFAEPASRNRNRRSHGTAAEGPSSSVVSSDFPTTSEAPTADEAVPLGRDPQLTIDCPDYDPEIVYKAKDEGRLCRMRSSSLLVRLRWSLVLFQIVGLFPASLPRPQRRSKKSIQQISSMSAYGQQFCESAPADSPSERMFRITKSIFFAAITIIYILLNLYAVKIMFGVIKIYLSDTKNFGMWHPETVAGVITSMKPVQSLVNLVIFTLMRHRHSKLLKHLEALNTRFVVDLGIVPNLQRINFTILALSGGLFTITFIVRTLEFLAGLYFTSMPPLPSNFSVNDMADAAVIAIDAATESEGAQYNKLVMEYLPFLLLPMFTIWQMLPLIYFVLITVLIRFWLGALIKQVSNDTTLKAHSMSTYFDHFCAITRVMRKTGNFFSLFVLFSLGLCVLTLCLTVYFVTQTKNIVPDDSDIIFYFNFVWSTLQILVLLTYLVSICINGFKTNEKSRKVLQAALSTKPANQDDRFQIFCLSEKIHLQYGWGISVWRGFLIERGLLFTIVGLIITYALVLLRMKPQVGCSPETLDRMEDLEHSVSSVTSGVYNGTTLRLARNITFNIFSSTSSP